MPVDVVAEISGNHGGRLENALLLITEAKRSGADAVKFQAFNPEKLADKRSKNPVAVKLARDFHGCSLLDLYRRTHTPRDWFRPMILQAMRDGIAWFSSVFDPDDVAFLETLGCPRYKISAFEMLDGDLINAVVATGKPIIMSVRPREGLTVLVASPYGEASEVNLGLSDHTPTMNWSPPSGCPMVERHIRLPDVVTPDSEFSSTPDEFRAYVAAIRGSK